MENKAPKPQKNVLLRSVLLFIGVAILAFVIASWIISLFK